MTKLTLTPQQREGKRDAKGSPRRRAQNGRGLPKTAHGSLSLFCGRAASSRCASYASRF